MDEIPKLPSEFNDSLMRLYSLRDRWENLKQASPILRDDKPKMDELDKKLEAAISNTSTLKPLPADTTLEGLEKTITTMEKWFPPGNE